MQTKRSVQGNRMKAKFDDLGGSANENTNAAAAGNAKAPSRAPAEQHSNMLSSSLYRDYDALAYNPKPFGEERGATQSHQEG